MNTRLALNLRSSSFSFWCWNSRCVPQYVLDHGVFVREYMFTCVSMGMHIHIHVCVEARVQCIFRSCSLIFLRRQGFSHNPELISLLMRLSGQRVLGIPLPLPSQLWLWIYSAELGPFLGCGDLNPGPRAPVASTLSTEPAP